MQFLSFVKILGFQSLPGNYMKSLHLPIFQLSRVLHSSLLLDTFPIQAIHLAHRGESAKIIGSTCGSSTNDSLGGWPDGHIGTSYEGDYHPITRNKNVPEIVWTTVVKPPTFFWHQWSHQWTISMIDDAIKYPKKLHAANMLLGILSFKLTIKLVICWFVWDTGLWSQFSIWYKHGSYVRYLLLPPFLWAFLGHFEAISAHPPTKHRCSGCFFFRADLPAGDCTQEQLERFEARWKKKQSKKACYFNIF